MKQSIFGFKEWIGEVPKDFRPDLVAGLTLWAMIVPEAMAYAGLAGAPTIAAGLYGIIIVLPIYALFASSRFLVPTSTAAVSVTFVTFLGVMSVSGQGGFSALILATAVMYLIFYFFKLGFIVDFISEPVSRGFMTGLAIFIAVGQLPKIFGLEKGDGNTFSQLYELVKDLPNANLAAFGFAILALLIIVGSSKINRKIPGALLALVIIIAICYFTNAGAKWDMKMVPELPKGLPKFTVPKFNFADLAVMIPASIGMVLVATSEAAVLAETLAAKHNQRVNINQQFLAFGVSNLVNSFFGGILGAGSTSSTMVNHDAGAKTLMSTIWAAIATMLTVLFLTGLFVFLPEAFLGTLIIHAVYRMISFRKVWEVREYSRGDFWVALIVLLSILIFDVLSGLIIGMLVNLLYIAYKTSKIKMEKFGYLKSDPYVVAPLDFPNIQPTPKDTLALGVTRGQIYYASARRAIDQAEALMAENPDAKYIVSSMARMDELDFTSKLMVQELEKTVKKSGRKLFLTNIRSKTLLDELNSLKLDPEVVDISLVVDVSRLKEHEVNRAADVITAQEVAKKKKLEEKEELEDDAKPSKPAKAVSKKSTGAKKPAQSSGKSSGKSVGKSSSKSAGKTSGAKTKKSNKTRK